MAYKLETALAKIAALYKVHDYVSSPAQKENACKVATDAVAERGRRITCVRWDESTASIVITVTRYYGWDYRTSRNITICGDGRVCNF